jgi:hypothetical protein
MKKFLLVSILLMSVVVAVVGCGSGGSCGGPGGLNPNATWKQVGADFATSASSPSKICFNGNTPYLATVELDGTHVYYFNNTNWVDTSSSGPVINGGYPSLLVANNKLYLSCRDYSTINYQATVSTYDSSGNTWAAYPASGGTRFTTNAITGSSLYYSNNTFYLGCCENSYGTVWTSSSGGSWSKASSSPSQTIASPIDMAGSGSTLYFFCSVGGYPVVYKIDSSWSALGAGGKVYPGGASSLSIGLNTVGVPYVAFYDITTTLAKVKKYNSGTASWDDVGSVDNVSDAKAVSNTNTQVRLFMDGNTPYVAYQDDATKTIFIKKYTGSSWSLVGGAGILCSDPISYISIYVKSGIPYISFIKNTTPIMAVWKCD